MRRPWSALEAVLGLSWASLGALMGPLGAVLRPRMAIGSEKARKQQTLIFRRFWTDFGLLGGPRGDSMHSRGAALIKASPFFDRSPPRWPQERPEGSQEPQERPKRAPRGPKRRSRGLQETPTRTQEAPRDTQDGSKSEKARKHKTLIFRRFWKDFGLLGGPRSDSRHSRGARLI